jgi:hypothetical protein
MRPKIEPMKKVARMLRSHEAFILNWFKARGESDQGNRRTVARDNRWDTGILDSLSQVAEEPPMSQQLSWPRRTQPHGR